jgi:hypothetical protein
MDVAEEQQERRCCHQKAEVDWPMLSDELCHELELKSNHHLDETAVETGVDEGHAGDNPRANAYHHIAYREMEADAAASHLHLNHQWQADAALWLGVAARQHVQCQRQSPFLHHQQLPVRTCQSLSV